MGKKRNHLSPKRRRTGADGAAGGVLREVDARVGEIRGLEGEGRDFSSMDPDLLAKAFSYLPQQELFEVMLVSRPWQKVVLEGSALWRKVDVFRKWGMRDRTGGILLHNVLRFAVEVSFSRAFITYSTFVMSVQGVLGRNLRVLKLPSECVPPAFYSVLCENCPLLKSVVVEGSLAHGNGPVHIKHPKLEELEFGHIKSPILKIDCPLLTRLSTYGNDEFSGGGCYGTLCAPTILCPRLTNLRLSFIHCASGVLESVAALSPSVTCLEAYLTQESPFSALSHFKSLKTLRVQGCGEEGQVPPNALNAWPLLESLMLDGANFAEDLEVQHPGLRSLELIDWEGVVSLRLPCPSLGYLKLRGHEFAPDCLGNINGFCPGLKRVEIGLVLSEEAYSEWGDDMEGPLEFVHETVEELVMENLTRYDISVTCSNLKTLEMNWVVEGEELDVLRFPKTLEAPNLRSLSICGYQSAVLGLGPRLSSLTSLESLKICGVSEVLKKVTFQHNCIRNVTLAQVEVGTLTFHMPLLAHVNITNAIVRVLKMNSKVGIVHVKDPHTQPWSDIRVKNQSSGTGIVITYVED